ncbi:type IV pilus assembly protein PilF [Marinospirillum celere]|uniref:Type IV pilus assembly protein PilF n=1 Tax=Marinospirillum celere TaxID=1122252 RepID=A0A1I1IYP8_9GAMM|nr:type IV pilus biogenesis/stability protein PilW [Marinospirillum celere]SFC41417.1 type IV pilus assembly protein PilF [Marinospirillum celere]
MPRLLIALLLLMLSGCATQPPWERTDPDKQADAYANLGHGYLEQGDYNRSLREFDRALALRPRHARALHGMALTLQAQEENQLAENFFKQVLQVDRNKTFARNNYAAFLFEQRRYDEARRELEIASRDIFYPERAIVFENLGYVALAQDDHQAAREYFRRSLGLNRNLVNAHRELLELYLPDEPERAIQHWSYLEQEGVSDRETLYLGLELAKITGNQQKQEQIRQRLNELNDNN